ncbi:MAG TPA: MFS transporter [Mycobacteriales bacterium]|nr:MFS transporter [Mycobacteriales bacterium]
MVLALGVAWVLDGLEITIVSALGPILSDKDTLGMSSGAVGLIATVYLLGEVFGALFFGKLSDMLGRKNLFIITLGVYLAGNALTAATWGNSALAISFLYLTRFVAGAGIGGEYAAINSAIDEMMPARYRGRVDIAINGTYWGGAILGTLLQLLLLNTLDHGLAWRLGFLAGPVIGIGVWNLRRHLPESPRWLVIHGREEEAEESIRIIEDEVRRSGQEIQDVPDDKAIEIHPQPPVRFLHLAKVLFQSHRNRTILGASLMITQSFLYNAIFFTYTLVLTKVYGISESWAPAFLIAFAAGNLIGPLTLGKLFDTIGRRKMIAGTYLLSGVLLAISAALFQAGLLNAYTQTACWVVIFFFASCGASAAYLTVSEIFPMEIRAQAIALFFAIAQCFGAIGPWFYGHLIGDGTNHGMLTIGYLIGAAVMIAGGLVETFLGIDAEGKSLEEVATPLSAAPQRLAA